MGKAHAAVVDWTTRVDVGSQSGAERAHHFRLDASMKRSSARLRHALALVVVVALLVLAGVAWSTQPQSMSGTGALGLLVLALAATALFVWRELKLRAAVHAELEDGRARLLVGERRLRAIADNMPAYIACVDSTGTYRFINAAFRTLFGMDTERIVGRRTAEMMGPVNSAVVAPYVEAVLSGRVAHFEKVGMGLHPDRALSAVPLVSQGLGVQAPDAQELPFVIPTHAF